jgi:hypothetical protein
MQSVWSRLASWLVLKQANCRGTILAHCQPRVCLEQHTKDAGTQQHARAGRGLHSASAWYLAVAETGMGASRGGWLWPKQNA